MMWYDFCNMFFSFRAQLNKQYKLASPAHKSILIYIPTPTCLNQLRRNIRKQELKFRLKFPPLDKNTKIKFFFLKMHTRLKVGGGIAWVSEKVKNSTTNIFFSYNFNITANQPPPLLNPGYGLDWGCFSGLHFFTL